MSAHSHGHSLQANVSSYVFSCTHGWVVYAAAMTHRGILKAVIFACWLLGGRTGAFGQSFPGGYIHTSPPGPEAISATEAREDYDQTNDAAKRELFRYLDEQGGQDVEENE